MAHMLRQSQFDAIDRNRDGVIDRHEWTEYLASQSPPRGENPAHNLFTRADDTASSAITDPEEALQRGLR